MSSRFTSRITSIVNAVQGTYDAQSALDAAKVSMTRKLIDLFKSCKNHDDYLQCREELQAALSDEAWGSVRTTIARCIGDGRITTFEDKDAKATRKAHSDSTKAGKAKATVAKVATTERVSKSMEACLLHLKASATAFKRLNDADKSAVRKAMKDWFV